MTFSHRKFLKAYFESKRNCSAVRAVIPSLCFIEGRNARETPPIHTWPAFLRGCMGQHTRKHCLYLTEYHRHAIRTRFGQPCCRRNHLRPLSPCCVETAEDRLVQRSGSGKDRGFATRSGYHSSIVSAARRKAVRCKHPIHG